MNTAPRGASIERYLLDWIAPALFALLVSSTIRFHSLIPMPTMPRMVGDLLALAAIVLATLMALGRRFTVSPEIALILLAFVASATVSVLGSGGADISLQRLELYFAMVLLSMTVYLTYRDVGHLPLESYFLAISLVHLPFLLAAILWIKDLGGPPFWKEGFRVAHFANVRQFAEFSFFAAVSSTGLCLLSRRLVVPSYLLAAAAMFGIILTGSRGAALSWAVFVLLACCFSQTRVRAAIHGVLVLALAASLVWYLDHSGKLLSPNLFARVASEQLGQESFNNSRFDLWVMSLRQIAVHPLFGSGPEGYWLSGCCNPRVMQAHNFVLQFLMEFGGVGCVIAVLLFARTVKGLGGPAAAASLALATPGNRVLLCLLVSFLGYSLIDQTMYHLVPLLHFALFAGLFAAGLVHVHAARDPVVTVPCQQPP